MVKKLKYICKRNFSGFKGKRGILGNKIYCWGDVGSGSLGIGMNDSNTSIPIKMDSIDKSGYIDIGLGINHGLILSGNGNVYSFGNNQYNVLGYNSDNNIVNTPILVDNLENIVKISCGNIHNGCIDDSGNVYTWGYTGNILKWLSYLGISIDGMCGGSISSTPNKVNINEKITDICCGNNYTLCLSEDGNVYSFGNGIYGNLGNCSTNHSIYPRKLEWFSKHNIKIKNIYCNHNYSILLSNDNILYGFGSNTHSQIINNSNENEYIITPEIINTDNIGDIIHVSLSKYDACIVNNSGDIYYWGNNEYIKPTKIELNDDINIDVSQCHLTLFSYFMISKDGILYSHAKKSPIFGNILELGCGDNEPCKTASIIHALKDEFTLKIVGNSDKNPKIFALCL